MRTVSSTPGLGKKNLRLAAIAVLGGLLPAQLIVAQVTTSWTGDGGQNVWTRNGNWSTNLQPNTGSIALIQSGGTGTNLFLREGTSGSVDVGTLIFNHASYRNILSGTGLATLNFGASGGIDFDGPPEEKGSGEGPRVIGEFSGSNPTVSFQLPTAGLLTFRARREVELNAGVFGTGSVQFDRLGTMGLPVITIGSNTQSEFSGGATLNPDVNLLINGSSNPGFTNGPLGVGTTALAGGILSLNSVTLGNYMHVTADSLVTGSGTLTGNMLLSTQSGTIQTGRRMQVDAGNLFVFNNATYSPTDTGTFSVLSTAEGYTAFDVI